MKNNESIEILEKLKAYYGKDMTDENAEIWMEELNELDCLICLDVLEEIKTHPDYSKFMPTVPQFLNLYKKQIPFKSKEQDYCYVCNNKGHEILRIQKKVNDQVLVYDYALHCDCCEKGNREKIDYTNKRSSERVYSEPISKYFDIEELKKNNKSKINNEKSNMKNQIKNIKVKIEKLL